MKRNINQQAGRFEWVLDTWYEKTALVVGWIFVVIMLISFVAGVISGATNSYNQ